MPTSSWLFLASLHVTKSAIRASYGGSRWCLLVEAYPSLTGLSCDPLTLYTALLGQIKLVAMTLYHGDCPEESDWALWKLPGKESLPFTKLQSMQSRKVQKSRAELPAPLRRGLIGAHYEYILSPLLRLVPAM
eukprot:4759182-Pyramimonas_sp.AAC.1